MNLSDAMKDLITERQEIALKRIKNNPFYNEICFQQEKSGEAVEKILQRLKKRERKLIIHYYDREILKTLLEFDEIYIQGVSDAFRLYVSLITENERAEITRTSA